MAKRKQAAKQLGKNFVGGLKNNISMLGDAVKATGDIIDGDFISAGNRAVSGIKKSVKSAKYNRNIGKNLLGILFNHPEWYENYPLSGLVNLNFGRRKGIFENVSGSTALNTDASTSDISSIPSVASIETLLWRPYTDTNDFEQAVTYLYSTIRSANSGNVNWYPKDLADYILDVRQMHAIYADMRRTYASLKDIRITDSKTPAVFLAALGKDYESFSRNDANLRAYANKLSIQISKLLPLDLDILNRTRWMYSNYFLDSDDAKASPFVFSLSEISSTHGSNLTIGVKSVTDDSTGIDYDTYIRNVQTLMSEIVSDERYGYIAGDILKAFGERAIYPSEIWDENMSAPFIYDEAALTQIQNATLRLNGSIGTYTRTYGCTKLPEEFQFAGWPTYRLIDAVNSTDNPVMTSYLQKMVENLNNATTSKLSSLYNTENGYVNSYKNDISSGEVLSYTRLKHDNVYLVDDNSVGIECYHGGTEIVTGIIVYQATQSYINKELQASQYYLDINYWTIGQFIYLGESRANHHLGLITSMDWFPLTTPILYNPETEVVTTFDPMWDFNNYARLGEGNLNSFHGYAIMSLLATDRVIKQNNTTVINDSKGIVGK